MYFTSISEPKFTGNSSLARSKLHHKASYPWLLPGFNSTLSRMPKEFWKSTPHDSNLVETAHVGTNQNTGIRLTPREAIEKYVVFQL